VVASSPTAVTHGAFEPLVATVRTNVVDYADIVRKSCAKPHMAHARPTHVAAFTIPSLVAAASAKIADSPRFQGFIFAVIVLNGVVLGLQTYPGIEDSVGTLLTIVNEVCVGIFVVELAIRISAYGRRPLDFFRDGWNVFDFVVILAAFAPGLRENATLLRLARLLRVVRIVSVLPEFRVLVRGMVRSLPPLGSMAVMAVLLIYVYGMVGWILFHEQDPEHWGTLGDAMLNLFVMLTLEDWPRFLDRGMEIYPASWIYFVSYILLASFLLFNILIAIIINSMEAARAEEARDARLLRQELQEAEEAMRDERQQLVDAMRALRDAVDELDDRLAAGGVATGPPARSPET
jgi:voltage-gated sodium channel